MRTRWKDGRAEGRKDGPGSRTGADAVLPLFRRSLPLLLLLACQPYTSRPAFEPLPAATQLPVHLTIAAATTTLADALKADSIPVEKVVARDGYIETPWFDTTGYARTTARPLGQRVVRVRAWVDPAQPGHSIVTLEGVYRLLADPSRPGRELDQPLPPDHPVALKLTQILKRLGEEYGETGAR